MAKDETGRDRSGLPDERKAPRKSGGKREDRAEVPAAERSVIPGPRSHGGTNRASAQDQQTEDHTRRRGPGPQDDVEASDREAPDLASDERRD